MTAAAAGKDPRSWVSPWPSTAYQGPIKSGSVLYRGAVVARNTSGEWVPASADNSLIVYGFARLADADSITGTGSNEIVVDSGCKLLTGSGLAQTDEGATVYVVDDSTWSLSSSSGARPIMGKVIKYVSATAAYIAIDPNFSEARRAPWMQTGTATLASGTATVSTGIVLTSASEVIPIETVAITGSTNFASLRELKASRVTGNAGTASMVLEAVGSDGAKDTDAAGAIRFVILTPQ